MDAQPLTRPRIYLIRMAVFLVLAGFIAFILYRQIWAAFLANPGLNALIIGVMLIGIVLAIRQVWRLFPEVRWVNSLIRDEEDPAAQPQPVLLAPMAALISEPVGQRRAFGRHHALAARLRRRPPRRKPRDRALSRRPSRVPRPSRHVLGPHRDRRIGRADHRVAAHRPGRGSPVRRIEERPRRPAPGHGPLLLGLALRPRRLARRRLPRPAGRAGAEPLLHRARGLACDLDRPMPAPKCRPASPLRRPISPSPSTG